MECEHGDFHNSHFCHVMLSAQGSMLSEIYSVGRVIENIFSARGKLPNYLLSDVIFNQPGARTTCWKLWKY